MPVTFRSKACFVHSLIKADIFIISISILGSLILVAGGNIRYVDALFMAAGCATQGGLNT